MYIKSLLSWVWPLHKNIYKPKHKTHPTNTQTLNLTMIVTGKNINSQPPKIYNNFQFPHILAMRVCWIWDTQKPMLFGISEVKPGTSHLQVSSLFMHAGVQTEFKSYSKRKDLQIITYISNILQNVTFVPLTKKVRFRMIWGKVKDNKIF